MSCHDWSSNLFTWTCVLAGKYALACRWFSLISCELPYSNTPSFVFNHPQQNWKRKTNRKKQQNHHKTNLTYSFTTVHHHKAPHNFFISTFSELRRLPLDAIRLSVMVFRQHICRWRHRANFWLNLYSPPSFCPFASQRGGSTWIEYRKKRLLKLGVVT